MKKISVLHILGGVSNAGAGRGTYWLHRGLTEAGIDSSILIQHSLVKNDPKVIPAYRSPEDKAMIRSAAEEDQRPLSNYPLRDPFIFSPGVSGIDMTRYEVFNKADIIHLHWINNGFLSIRQIAEIKKPIVWTFRDAWPMTGGCHVPYQYNCERFKDQCGCCPHLGSKDVFDLSWHVMMQKKKHFGTNIFPVAMSPWMHRQIKESALFKDKEAMLILNNIDTETFSPFDRQNARHLLNLPHNKKIILFGAINLDDKHKGLSLFRDSINQYPDKGQILCVFFGRGKSDSLQGFEVDRDYLGFVEDDEKLRMIFSAADLFVAPIEHDNFSKTMGEAMACGLPVVSIKMKEGSGLLQHQENSYLAKESSPEEILQGIKWILSLDPEKYNELSRNSRDKILENCSFEVVSKKYIELYLHTFKTYHPCGG